jgi:hypothetical protein
MVSELYVHDSLCFGMETGFGPAPAGHNPKNRVFPTRPPDLFFVVSLSNMHCFPSFGFTVFVPSSDYTSDLGHSSGGVLPRAARFNDKVDGNPGVGDYSDYTSDLGHSKGGVLSRSARMEDKPSAVPDSGSYNIVYTTDLGQGHGGVMSRDVRHKDQQGSTAGPGDYG